MGKRDVGIHIQVLSVARITSVTGREAEMAESSEYHRILVAIGKF